MVRMREVLARGTTKGEICPRHFAVFGLFLDVAQPLLFRGEAMRPTRGGFIAHVFHIHEDAWACPMFIISPRAVPDSLLQRAFTHPYTLEFSV